MIALSSLAALAALSSPQDPTLTEGLRLVRELGCAACHTAPAEYADLIAPPPGPDLTKVGERILPDYFLDYLIDPMGHKPGSRMPNLFAGRDENPRTAWSMARALPHFLGNLGDPIDTTPVPTSNAELERGRQLFHGVGCVACHSPLETPEDLELPWWEFETPPTFDALANTPELGDVVHLGDLSKKTTVRALTKFLLSPHDARPAGRMPDMGLDEADAKAIAAYLLRHQLIESATAPGLRYEYFEEPGLETVMTLDEYTAVRTGSIETIDKLPENRGDNFCFRFTGEVNVPETGEWTFYLKSDDGSRLWIDGKELIDNDGNHAPTERSGKRALEAGLHSIEVRMFERGGGEMVELQWEGPGVSRGFLSPDVLSHSSIALGPPTSSFELHPEAIRVGTKTFSKLRCFACHETGVPHTEQRPIPGIAQLDISKPRSCIGTDINPTIPLYDISQPEIDAIMFAIDAIQQGEELAHTTGSELEALRCTACHDRGGVGGPAAARRVWFEVVGDADIGDEGRIPPTLEGVGAKLRPDWLKTVLLDGGTARPYMKTRMPQYGHDLVAHLADAFLEEDSAGGVDKLTEIDEVEIGHGQRLVGTDGLGCINCHTFAGHESLGVPATDMSAMYTRLNQAWFHKLLVDPVALKMNTRMPDFWLNGKSPVTDIHDGDIDKQIEAIWSYLSLGEAAPYPKGLLSSPGEFELTPTEGPIHTGVFMRDMSPRTLVIGTPQRIHYAFDMMNSRLGRAWAGKYFDAAGTWKGRAGQLEVPPVPWIDFAPDAPFALLAEETASWPSEMGRDAGYRSLGRTMDESDMPTFRYSLNDVVIEETVRPELRLGGARLVRSFSIGGQVNDGATLYMRADRGSIEARDGEWLRDGELSVQVSRGGRALLRGEADAAELLIQINELPANIEVTYTW
ncbi:MAG: PA14 domain-containing protein [Planctomycetes bacterium]|nr:PA14 domain-containing protein [Planctomycetota bacterium]